MSSSIGPYEALGASLALHLGHTFADVQTLKLAPNTQRILDAICGDLSSMVEKKAQEIALRFPTVNEEACWDMAARRVMAHLCHRPESFPPCDVTACTEQAVICIVGDAGDLWLCAEHHHA